MQCAALIRIQLDQKNDRTNMTITKLESELQAAVLGDSECEYDGWESDGEVYTIYIYGSSINSLRKIVGSVIEKVSQPIGGSITYRNGPPGSSHATEQI